jgi:hypothetical protein
MGLTIHVLRCTNLPNHHVVPHGDNASVRVDIGKFLPTKSKIASKLGSQGAAMLGGAAGSRKSIGAPNGSNGNNNDNNGEEETQFQSDHQRYKFIRVRALFSPKEGQPEQRQQERPAGDVQIDHADGSVLRGEGKEGRESEGRHGHRKAHVKRKDKEHRRAHRRDRHAQEKQHKREHKRQHGHEKDANAKRHHEASRAATRKSDAPAQQLKSADKAEEERQSSGSAESEAESSSSYESEEPDREEEGAEEDHQAEVVQQQPRRNGKKHEGYFRAETPPFPRSDSPEWDPPADVSLPDFNAALAHHTGYVLRCLVLCRDDVVGTIPGRRHRLGRAYLKLDRIPLGCLRTTRITLRHKGIEAGTLDLRIGFDPDRDVQQQRRGSAVAESDAYSDPQMSAQSPLLATEVRMGDRPPLALMSPLAGRPRSLESPVDMSLLEEGPLVDFPTHTAREKHLSVTIQAPGPGGLGSDDDLVGIVEFDSRHVKSGVSHAAYVLIELERTTEQLGSSKKRKRKRPQRTEVVYEEKVAVHRDVSGDETSKWDVIRGDQQYIWPFVVTLPEGSTDQLPTLSGLRVIHFTLRLTAMLYPNDDTDASVVTLTLQERPK